MLSSLTLLTTSVVLTLVVTRWLWPLYQNYRRARESELPVLVCPIPTHNIFYRLIQIWFPRLLRDIYTFDGLKVSIFGWAFFPENDGLLRGYGNIFIVVNPSVNVIWCADAAVSLDMLSRRKAFIQSRLNSSIVRMQGDNVFTSNHDDWARQRRLVAPNFNERISETVWAESMRQALCMVDYMLGGSEEPSNLVVSSLHSIAINVLAKSAYGHSKAFKPKETIRDPKAVMSYVDAIWLCTTKLFYSFVFPSWFLRLPCMPAEAQMIGSAKAQLPGLTKNMLAAERQLVVSNGEDTQNNLMSMLVRLADSVKDSDGKSSLYLTDEEISGNLFVFTAAGFDTTANTMAYALILLGAYPEWQAWVQEELDFVWRGIKEEEKDSPDYEAVFPQLTRVLALMFETLRLFPAAPTVGRDMEKHQTIRRGDKVHQLDPSYRIYISIVDLHKDPTVWGADTLTFRPSRWIEPESGFSAPLTMPPRGHFMPWGAGPRVCPGMKTAQVEFVTVLSTLLRKCRVEAAPRPGETMEQAQNYLIEVARDSMQSLALQMNNPENIRLKWHRR